MDDFTPIMEVFLQTHTTYESSKYYNIYKHTFEIEEEDFEKIMKYVELNDDKIIDVCIKIFMGKICKNII